MSHLIGVRVVRGPDWKWGDQDGGEGYAGTVIDTQSGSSTRPVTVVWDSGFKGHYRAGPKGSYDLRIVDDPAGKLHRNIICGNSDCRSKAIRGIRWKCVDCELSFCNVCFMNKKPHNRKHNQFQRFDNTEVIDPPTVTCWIRDRPENRIKLMGIFKGVEVMKGFSRSWNSEDEMNPGVVISDELDKNGNILVEWITTGERSREERRSSSKLVFKNVVGGYYFPESLLSVNINIDGISNTIQASRRSSTLRKDINEWVKWMKKGPPLFMKAIEEGDIKSAQFVLNEEKQVINTRNADGRTALHVACAKGHKRIVRWLLDVVKMDLEEPDVDGFRAIHHAVIQCNPEVFKILIERKAQLNIFSGTRRSLLDYAVYNQFTECIRLLIYHGCDVNVKNPNGQTPLHSAIHYGRAPVIIEMLSSSDRINWHLMDNNGFNVLHLAVIKNNWRAIECILGNADQGLIFCCFPDTQSTVLHFACIQQNFQVAELLIKHLPTGNQIFDDPIRSKKLLEAKNTNGMTALMIAVIKRNFPLIELLVKAGADVKATDKNGDTGLSLSAKDPLLKECIPPKDLLSPTVLKDLEKYPALFFLGYLIEKGFGWNVANSSGFGSAYFLLQQGYSKEVIAILNGLETKMQIRHSSGGSVFTRQCSWIKQPLLQPTCSHDQQNQSSVSVDVRKRGGQVSSRSDTRQIDGDSMDDDEAIGAQTSKDEVDSPGEEGPESKEVKAFAKHFKLRREDLNFTQKEVGLALGAFGRQYSRQSIGHFENNVACTKRLYQRLRKWLEAKESSLNSKNIATSEDKNPIGNNLSSMEEASDESDESDGNPDRSSNGCFRISESTDESSGNQYSAVNIKRGKKMALGKSLENPFANKNGGCSGDGSSFSKRKKSY